MQQQKQKLHINRQLSRKKYSTILEMNFIFQLFEFSTHAIFQSFEKNAGLGNGLRPQIDSVQQTKRLFGIFKSLNDF